MTTYYVKASGNNTTGLNTANAFTTISVGAAAAVAGDTINVLAGNYAGGIFLRAGSVYHDATAGNPITLRSSPALAAKIIASGAPPTGGGNNAMIDVRVSGWVFDGFEITAQAGYSGGAGTWAWTLGGAGQFRSGFYCSAFNNVFQNNYIHHICLANPGGSGGGGVICDGFYTDYTTAANHYIRYNHVHDIASSLTANSAHGIYVSTTTVYVFGNLVYNQFGGVCIHGWHGFNAGSYANNTVFNAAYGLLIGQGDSGVGSGVTNFRGFNNTIQNCTTGISEQGLIGSSPRNLWSNNHIFNCTTAYAINAASTATSKLVGDPKMINYISTGGGDYNLSVGSSLINAGTSSLSGIDAPILDIANTSRPFNSLWDVGAYEFVPVDTTAPLLTLPTGTSTGTSTATGTSDTDTAEGTLYCWTTTNATETAVNIKSNGTTQSISSIGTKTFLITSLSPATTYYAHFVHTDAAANDSLVSNSTAFTTNALSTLSPMGGSLRRQLRRGR